MENDIWRVLCERLERGERLAAATIATSDGSTPRSAGAKMLVGPDGIVAGTLGGGLVEARAAGEAAKTLRDGASRLLDIDMAGSAASGTDLICGGRVRIFVGLVEPDWAGLFRHLADRLDRGGDALLLTPTDGGPSPVAVYPESGGALASAASAHMSGGARLFEHGGVEYLLEPLRARAKLVLAGGGHVSLATARIASLVDFDVAVIDDRPEFANPERFPWLGRGRTLVVPGYERCLDAGVLGFPVTEKCFIVILTRGHSHDGEVLAQALATPAGYVGMIGSGRKRDAVYARLAERGFSGDDFRRVHCPVGLPLGGETPAEIAVSIVAQLIAARAGKLVET